MIDQATHLRGVAAVVRHYRTLPDPWPETGRMVIALLDELTDDERREVQDAVLDGSADE